MPTKVPGAEDFIPDTRDVSILADAVQACRGCELYRGATQGVFGQGSANATVMFVGPAGRFLDKALVSAGIDRDGVYVTNAVKHFKFTLPERGKRRIHKTPSRTEVVACRPWLLAELDAVRPEVVVLLGATAAKALLGSDFRVTAHRGEVLSLPPVTEPTNLDIDPAVVATVHPSSVLRGPAENRQQAFDALVEDLSVVALLMRGDRRQRRSRPK